MSILIGVHGAKGSGKDTVFGFMHEWAGENGVVAGRRGFADALKHSFARLFIPDASLTEAVQWMERVKDGGELEIREVQYSKGGQITTLTHQVPARVALQRFGTEGHRGVFGDDFWVDHLLPIRPDESDSWAMNFAPFMDFSGLPPEICVITDLRFENEAERVHQLGGEVWWINRPEVKDLEDTHASEAGLPLAMIDVTINNDSGLDELRDAVRAEMELRHKIYLKGE